MKGKAAKLKLQRRISDYAQMIARGGEEKYSGYARPGSGKRT